MKRLPVITLLLLLSCTQKPASDTENQIHPPSFTVITALQDIFDREGLQGSVLVFDVKDNTYYTNDLTWPTKGFLPASTFKIPNSIIALETGVMASDSTLIEWDGEKRAMGIWEKDLFFRDAFHVSCVPCYQEIASNIGPVRMNDWLSRLDYGSMEVDSLNINIFWLTGDSHISQLQQINFLRRFWHQELPISERTHRIMKSMMLIESTPDWTLSGKTGWSVRGGNNNGWFVGYVEVGKDIYFFATNVIPGEAFNMDMFAMIRKDVTMNALHVLGIIKN